MRSDLVLVGAVVGACVWVARGTRWAAAIECAFPLAALALLVTDKPFVLGVIVAVAFAAAALVNASPVLLVAGVLLLRWIPLREVEVWRELVVLGGALALYGVRASRPHSPGVPPGDDGAEHGRAGRPTGAGGTPALHLAAALAVAAVTPVHPGKAALFPLILAALIAASRPMWDRLQPVLAGLCLIAACFARWSLVPILIAAAFALLVPFLDKLKPLAYATALALFAMWPWSGVVARALPLLTRFEPPAGEVRIVGLAMARGETKEIAIPPVRHVVVVASAANAAQMRLGRVIGFVNARPIRIGDVADFGFTRRPHFFAARNDIPRISRGDIRGYGATAWLHGAGAVGVASSSAFTSLRFRAADDLPPDARLQIESIELPAR